MIRIDRYSGWLPQRMLGSGRREDVAREVRDIIARVREKGDEALIDYALRFSGVRLSALEVPEEDMHLALERMEREEPEWVEAARKAASHIREFHEMELGQGFSLRREGVELTLRITPIEKVGVYIPAGAAPLSSTVLMSVIPARIAGVSEISIATAPEADPHILAAAAIAGADRVYLCSGAQAIAALAYGTETVGRVDKIVGPGSAYVAEAKRQVYGDVGIDMIAGPSEIMILSDARSDAGIVAADMLSQAEHDQDASAILVTDSMELALRVQEEIEARLSSLPREEIARASIEQNGRILVVEDIEQGIEIAGVYAPEHLELMVDEPERLVTKVRSAGSVFLGRYSPEALGDYMAGPNHTLPTGGSARFSSPLSVDDFVKKTQYICYSAEALAAEAGDIARLARAEGLEAHALSALARGGPRQKSSTFCRE